MADLLSACLPEKAASLHLFLHTLLRRVVERQHGKSCYAADAAREAHQRSTTTVKATSASANKRMYPLSLEEAPEATSPPLHVEGTHCSSYVLSTRDYEQPTAATQLSAPVCITPAAPQGAPKAPGGGAGAAVAASVISTITVAGSPWLVLGASADRGTKLIPYKVPVPLEWAWWIAAAFLCAGLLFTAKFITYTLRVPRRDRSLWQELLHAAAAALMLGLALSFILISSGVYY